MANDNTHNCCHHDREQIEISEGVRPMAVLVDEDGCGCECSEVELHTAKEPDILLFEEYCEEYADDIVLAKEAAIAAKETVEAKSAIIIEKENLLLDDNQTIKRELRQGIIDIRADIAAALAELKTKIQNAVTTITSAISLGVGTITSNITAKAAALQLAIEAARDNVKSAVSTWANSILGTITTGVQSIKDKSDANTAAIRNDIANLDLNFFEECTEDEIREMFPVEED